MGSISVGDLKEILKQVPDDYEVLMEMHHKYDIPKDDGIRGWLAFINGTQINDGHKEIRLMN